MTRRLIFSTKLKVYPSLTMSGRVRTDAGTIVRYAFIRDFTYSLAFTHANDSEPESADAAKSDWSLVASPGHAF